jgi:hypothetical protein
MIPEIQQKWVAALRSGDYAQGSGLLRTSDNKFCCLGVLCDLAVKSGVSVECRQTDGYYVYDNAHGALPTSVVNWAGLHSANPAVSTDIPSLPLVPRLSWINDVKDNGDHRYDFDAIATIIEAEESL